MISNSRSLEPLLSTFRRIAMSRTAIWANDHLLLLCSIGISVPFLWSRVPFFYHFPFPLIMPDSLSYYTPVFLIDQGVWPEFAIRTPGYPLFLKFATMVENSWRWVLAVQNIFTLFSAWMMVYAIFRAYRRMTPWVTLAMLASILSLPKFYFDIAILPESLYSNLLVLFFAFLTLAIRFKRSFYFVLCSLCASGVILLRPSGLFLLVVFFLISLYLWKNKYARKHILGLFVPILAISLVWCSYNYFTLGQFTFTLFGEFHLSRATVTFWETSPEFPPEVNQGIVKIRNWVSEEDRHTLENSWNINKLYATFSRYYPGTFEEIMEKMRENPDYFEDRLLYRKISFLAIARHPVMYVKFFTTMFAKMMFHNIQTKHSYLPQLLPKAYYNLATRKNYAVPQDPKWFADFLKEHADAGFSGKAPDIPFPLQRSISFYISWNRYVEWHDALFHNLFWAFSYLITFFTSLYVLIRSRYAHREAFFLFILGVSVWGAGMMVALVQLTVWRYSFPLEFVYYLSLALFPTLFSRGEAVERQSCT